MPLTKYFLAVTDKGVFQITDNYKGIYENFRRKLGYDYEEVPDEAYWNFEGQPDELGNYTNDRKYLVIVNSHWEPTRKGGWYMGRHANVELVNGSAVEKIADGYLLKSSLTDTGDILMYPTVNVWTQDTTLTNANAYIYLMKRRNGVPVITNPSSTPAYVMHSILLEYWSEGKPNADGVYEYEHKNRVYDEYVVFGCSKDIADNLEISYFSEGMPSNLDRLPKCGLECYNKNGELVFSSNLKPFVISSMVNEKVNSVKVLGEEKVSKGLLDFGTDNITTILKNMPYEEKTFEVPSDLQGSLGIYYAHRPFAFTSGEYDNQYKIGTTIAELSKREIKIKKCVFQYSNIPNGKFVMGYNNSEDINTKPVCHYIGDFSPNNQYYIVRT